MEEKKYNFNEEDSQFKNLAKMLHELPKVKAEDNFEFNLLTKIKNGNYDAKKYKESSIGLAWVYAPVTALVLSTVLIFLVFNPEAEEFDNPLMANPPLRPALTLNAPDTMIANTSAGSETAIALNDIPAAKQTETAKKNSRKSGSYVVVLQPNDVVVKEEIDYPFEQGVDLDTYVGSEGLQGQSGSHVASYGDYFNFNGFFVKINPNEKEIMLEKARLDSLEKAQKIKKLK